MKSFAQDPCKAQTFFVAALQLSFFKLFNCRLWLFFSIYS